MATTITSTLQDDELAVWEALGSRRASYTYLTDEQRRRRIRELITSFGGVQKAVQTLQDRERMINDPSTPQLGGQFPREGAPFKSIEFDNIKVFYQPLRPGERHMWNFYIARPGAPPNECIDWRAAGIKILSRGFDGEWGECFLLAVPPETHVRIEYPFGEERRTHEIVFPNLPSPFLTHYLEEI